MKRLWLYKQNHSLYSRLWYVILWYIYMMDGSIITDEKVNTKLKIYMFTALVWHDIHMTLNIWELGLYNTTLNLFTVCCSTRPWLCQKNLVITVVYLDNKTPCRHTSTLQILWRDCHYSLRPTILKYFVEFYFSVSSWDLIVWTWQESE